MTDGSEECIKRIFDAVEHIKEIVDANAKSSSQYQRRMEATVVKIEDSVEQHQRDVDSMFERMNKRVDAVDAALEALERDRATIMGAIKALSLLWVAVTAIVSLFPGALQTVVEGMTKR